MNINQADTLRLYIDLQNFWKENVEFVVLHESLKTDREFGCRVSCFGQPKVLLNLKLSYHYVSHNLQKRYKDSVIQSRFSKWMQRLLVSVTFRIP